MSKFDYFWNAETNKDGITFSEAIQFFQLDRDKAMDCLKNAGHPIGNDDEILSLRQFESLKHESLKIDFHKLLRRNAGTGNEVNLSVVSNFLGSLQTVS